MEENSVLYRAVQPTKRGNPKNDEYHYKPCDDSRALPLSDKAHEGRANPKGIPFLYAAMLENVAVSEIRPVPAVPFTMLKLRVNQNLRLVDLTQDNNSYGFIIPDNNPEETESIVWSHISDAFSVPMMNEFDSANYAPTQIIAEQIRLLGYDGIRFVSQFCRNEKGKNHNVVIFDKNKVSITEKSVYSVDEVQYKYTNHGEDVHEWDLITKKIKGRQGA